MAQELNIFSCLKVVDLASYVAGSAATTILSDFGSDVIQLERPETASPAATLLPCLPIPWAREIHGANSILLDLHIGRLVADADALHSHEGMRELNALIVGKPITGFSAFV